MYLVLISHSSFCLSFSFQIYLSVWSFIPTPRLYLKNHFLFHLFTPLSCFFLTTLKLLYLLRFPILPQSTVLTLNFQLCISPILPSCLSPLNLIYHYSILGPCFSPTSNFISVGFTSRLPGIYVGALHVPSPLSSISWTHPSHFFVIFSLFALSRHAVVVNTKTALPLSIPVLLSPCCRLWDDPRLAREVRRSQEIWLTYLLERNLTPRTLQKCSSPIERYFVFLLHIALNTTCSFSA